jgi:hypothetical protein
MNTLCKTNNSTGGLPATPMTRLKVVWNRLSEKRQKQWRDRFDTRRDLAGLRRALKREFGTALGCDTQLIRFRKWIVDQDDREDRAERLWAVECRIREAHPDWTLDEVRAEVLRQCYYETLASGNYTLGLKTIAVEIRVKMYELAREKYQFDAIQACLASLPELKAISNNPKLTPEEKAKGVQEILFPNGKIPSY